MRGFIATVVFAGLISTSVNAEIRKPPKKLLAYAALFKAKDSVAISRLTSSAPTERPKLLRTPNGLRPEYSKISFADFQSGFSKKCGKPKITNSKDDPANKLAFQLSWECPYNIGGLIDGFAHGRAMNVKLEDSGIVVTDYAEIDFGYRVPFEGR